VGTSTGGRSDVRLRCRPLQSVRRRDDGDATSVPSSGRFVWRDAAFPCFGSTLTGRGIRPARITIPRAWERWMESIDHAVHQLDRLCGSSEWSRGGRAPGRLLGAGLRGHASLSTGLVLVACPPTGKAHVASFVLSRPCERARRKRYRRVWAYLAQDSTWPARRHRPLAGLDAATLGLATPCDVMLASSDHIGTGVKPGS